MRPASLLTVTAALLAACTPRQPVGVVPAPAPPAPAATAAAAEPPPPPLAGAAAEARARSAWEEGTRLGRDSRWGEAVALYLEATRLDPGKPVYHLALANAYLQQGREHEGADALLAGIRAEEALPSPNHRVLAVDYERLIELLTRLGRLDEARSAHARQNFHRMMRDAARP